jgi:hypothetical protein
MSSPDARHRKQEKRRRKREKKQQAADPRVVALAISSSKNDLPIISQSLEALIRPMLDLLGPERRTMANFQDALDVGKEGWNLQIELDGSEDLPAELVRRSQQFVGRGLAPEIGRQVLERLVERKRKLFPNDNRLITKAIALRGPHGLKVLVTWERYATVH